MYLEVNVYFNETSLGTADVNRLRAQQFTIIPHINTLVDTHSYSADLLSTLPIRMALDMQNRQPNRIQLTTDKDYIQQRYEHARDHSKRGN